ncbi:hypothetical protein VNO77_37842 [Canavalia gladiata]|uniref:Uncharacterized protein n=1 Tax=Canavalia gladiata TaxID=3824 RepID=A0AAN9KAW1_CANGL
MAAPSSLLVRTLENCNVVSICNKSVSAIGSKNANLFTQLGANENQIDLCTVKNMKSLSNADRDGCFVAESLNREGDTACDASNCSIKKGVAFVAAVWALINLLNLSFLFEFLSVWGWFGGCSMTS